MSVFLATVAGFMNGRPKLNLNKYTCSYKKEWQINHISSQLLLIRSILNFSFSEPLRWKLSQESYTTFNTPFFLYKKKGASLVREFSSLSSLRNVESGFSSSCQTISMIKAPLFFSFQEKKRGLMNDSVVLQMARGLSILL